ncbi:MAG: tetratricopeptide (TPR) repeat protein [Chlamydiales bacterium]|jgi:tetratricopeptide (TPR) repeat protein
MGGKSYKDIVNEVCSYLSTEFAGETYKLSPLVTYEQHVARAKANVKRSAKLYQKRIRSGLGILHEEKLLDKEKVKEIIDSYSVKKLMKKSRRAEFREILGFDEDKMVEFYLKGTEFFYQCQYAESSDIFLFLTAIAPSVSAFWLSLGLSENMKGDPESALGPFIMAYNLNRNNLNILMNVVNCYITLKREEEAKIFVDEVLDYLNSKKNPQKYEEIREKIITIREKIK